MFESFVSKRFLAHGKNQKGNTLLAIATVSITLSVLVMIMSVSILRGFQQEITNKVVGFGSHIVVQSYSEHNLYDAAPILASRPEAERLKQLPEVKSIQYFAEKGGMIKTSENIHGIIFKGIGTDFDTSFFHTNLDEGRMPIVSDILHNSDLTPQPSTEVLVSRTIARKLGLAVGDKIRTYFWQGGTYRARVFVLTGIYNSDISEFDEHYVIGDIAQIQKINGWGRDSVAGYEVLLNDATTPKAIAESQSSVNEAIGYDLTSQTIVERNPTLFSWLQLLNSNIWLILGVMSLVCVVAITSAFLIMIFQNTSTIGILKTLGANNGSVRKIFIIKSSHIILRGIVWGNVIALLLCIVQKSFHVVRLDSASYSMSFVPIELNGMTFALISIATFAVCLLSLLVPANHIAHISPAQTIKQ